MKELTRKGFLRYSHREQYQKRIEHAKKIIKICYENYNNPYVSYSGGKDSIVMTHLVLQQYPEANIWHWDYGNDLMPRQFEKEVIDNLESYGAKNIFINKRTGLGENTSSGYKQFFSQVEENKQEYNWDIGLVGVRQEESCNRKQKYTQHFMNDCCYPLLKLSYLDIWAYILTNDLKYPTSYDIQGDFREWDKVRFVTFFDKEFETMSYDNGLFFGGFR